MASLVRDIDYIVVNNEVEALNLECNYIKKLSPKFNVLLKDDKTYPYIKVTIKDKYPLIYVTRRRLEDKALYFGPYTNVGAMRDALHTIKEIFPVKRCKYTNAGQEDDANGNDCIGNKGNKAIVHAVIREVEDELGQGG